MPFWDPDTQHNTPGTDQFPVPVLSRILSNRLFITETACGAVVADLLLRQVRGLSPPASAVASA